MQYFSDNGWLQNWIDDSQFVVEQASEEDWRGWVAHKADKNGVPVLEVHLDTHLHVCMPLNSAGAIRSSGRAR